MTLWSAVIVASVAVYSWKLIGFLIPERFVNTPKIKDLATLLTVSLLAALVGIQTFSSSIGLSLDARVPAVLIAAILFWARLPFVVVVVVSAAAAALLRLWF